MYLGSAHVDAELQSSRRVSGETTHRVTAINIGSSATSISLSSKRNTEPLTKHDERLEQDRIESGFEAVVGLFDYRSAAATRLVTRHILTRRVPLVFSRLLTELLGAVHEKYRRICLWNCRENDDKTDTRENGQDPVHPSPALLVSAPGRPDELS